MRKERKDDKKGGKGSESIARMEVEGRQLLRECRSRWLRG